MTTFTAHDFGTYTFSVFDTPTNTDAIEEFDFEGTLEDAIDWAYTVACEGYEVDVFANNTIVAWVDESGATFAGQYAA